jgi:hypothetical protein
MDLVYVLGTGSKWQNNEIRYSLRSVQKYFNDFDKVVIVGHKPSFITKVHHIPCTDSHQGSQAFKERNIMHKILKACSDERVSDRFLFMNDDYFFLRELSARRFPNYHKGDLSASLKTEIPQNGYRHSLYNTFNILKALGCPTLHYDLHVPIIYHKKKFIWAMGNVDWDVDYGYTIKSLYANQHRLEGPMMGDCKLSQPRKVQDILKKIEDRFMFSIGDRAINDDLKLLMQSLYPNPSVYEVHR